MNCFLCYCFGDKLHMFQGDTDVLEKITLVLPDIAIKESMDPMFICATCLEEVSLFYMIKNESLQNCSRLKQFNTLLKGTDNFKYNELNIPINSGELGGELLTQRHFVDIKVEPNHEDLFLSEEIDIKEKDKEYDDCSQQLENDESNLNYLQDDEPSSSSNESTRNDKNVELNLEVHTKKKPYKCSTCQKTFLHRCNLNSHKLTHTGEKPHKCDVCHKTFARSDTLVTHVRIHTGEKPYKCLTCQKTFTQRSDLNKHTLSHTNEKPYECDLCHKTFNHKSNLIRHKRYHNNVRPYQCAVCNKGFITSDNLKIHMLTHTGDKPHQCHLCEYKCTTASNIKIHIRSHTGEKPFSCKHCEKSFTSSSSVKIHERRMHNNEDSK